MFNVSNNMDYINKKIKRPLYGAMWEPMIEPPKVILNKYKTGTLISADEFSPQIMIETAELIRPKADILQTDLPFAYQACCGSQWLEAILGCPIMVAENAIWAGHPQGSSLERFLKQPICNEWLDKLLECHAALCEWADGERFCSVPVLHGPLDILVAYVGAENIGFSFYDQPELLKSCLEKAADVFISVTKMLFKNLQAVDGGYAGRMHFLTEEKCVTMQNDASYLCSPQVFEQFILPIEKAIVSELDCVLYHMHNTSLHLWGHISEVGYKGIQVSVDPNGGPMEEQIKIYNSMQKQAPLMLSCWDMSQIDMMADALAPEGLCLTFIPSPEQSQILNTGAFREFDEWNEYYMSRISSPAQ